MYRDLNYNNNSSCFLSTSLQASSGRSTASEQSPALLVVDSASAAPSGSRSFVIVSPPPGLSEPFLTATLL